MPSLVEIEGLIQILIMILGETTKLNNNLRRFIYDSVGVKEQN